jgi:phage tail sheath gpL-like
VDYNCALIKVDRFAACIAPRVVGAELVIFLQTSSQWGARADTEEMSQTLLTNKKQRNLDLVHADNIIKPM